MNNSADLSVIFINDDTYNKDIQVRFPALEMNEVVDSYYIANTDGGMIASAASVPNKLLILLKNWIKRVAELRAEPIFLPVDFSDEYIGCFRIIPLQEHDIQIDYGYTRSICGYEVLPLELNPLSDMNNDNYNKTSVDIITTCESFIAMIESAAFALESKHIITYN